jgi:hypothetical protein
MQLIIDAQTNCHVSNWKTLDATSKKPNLIAKFTKGASDKKWRKFIRVLFTYGSEFYKNYFTDELTIELSTLQEKFAFVSLKLRAGDVKNSFWLPDMKIDLVWSLKISLEINTETMCLHISFIL